MNLCMISSEHCFSSRHQANQKKGADHKEGTLNNFSNFFLVGDFIF